MSGSGNRFLLFMDILGFSNLVQTRGEDEVMRQIEASLTAAYSWGFGVLHFSDTVLVYAQYPGANSTFWTDFVTVASRSFTQLLAQGIAIRGALSFGPFRVTRDLRDRHEVFFGTALIDAAKEEKNLKIVGIAASRSFTDALEESTGGRWLRAQVRDRVLAGFNNNGLILNPFPILRDRSLAQDFPWFYKEPEFDPWIERQELRALSFLLTQSSRQWGSDENAKEITKKYRDALEVYRKAVGEKCFSSAIEAAKNLPETDDDVLSSDEQ
jgi:hypothetical protein